MQKAVEDNQPPKSQDYKGVLIRLPKRDHLRLRVIAAQGDESMAHWTERVVLAALDGGVENAQTIKT